jgi:hypothetical protein
MSGSFLLWNTRRDFLANCAHLARMVYFTKKPPDLAARRQALVAEIQIAEQTLATARRAVMDAGKAGWALDKRTPVNARAREAEIDLDGLQNALSDLDAEITAAAEQARVAADEAQRKQTARALTAAAEKLEAAFAPLPDALEAGRAAYTELEHLLGSSGLPVLLQNLALEIPNAVVFHVAELRARAERTLHGDAPACLPAPFIPEIVKTEPAAPPTIQIFSLQNLQWKGGHCGAHQIHALPVYAAKEALRRHVALEADSQEAQAIIHNLQGLPHLLDVKVIDLERDPHTVTVYSASGKKLRDVSPKPFENYRAGEEPKKVWIDRGPEPKPGGPNDDVL